MVRFLYPKKAARLPRPWPLLRDNQSPDDLEARVAYHLHRLNIRGRRLADALGDFNTHRATALAQGRTALTDATVHQLATLFGLDNYDLTRSLTEAEQREWHFYRVSARHPVEVWSRARSAWSAAGYTNTRAAHVMHLTPNYVSNNSRNHNDKPTPLTFPPARLLSTALALPHGTNTLLPDHARFTFQPATGVTDKTPNF